MADIIQLLPDHVANQIAAGEVVQRPASVVKELLENAIDARATIIKLVVKDGGRTLIQVIDNGTGMSHTDARFCFERHATSKITSADDLFQINTKGFRGEALASIAAIAHVELNTREGQAELGTAIKIEGGTVASQEFTAVPEGTSISVKHLFFNIPARRNFLKSQQVELRHITDEFHRVALAHPDIEFHFFHNGSELFHLPPASLKKRIVGIFGGKTKEKLVPVEEETEVVKLHGFICKPEYAKKSRGEQYFFVNNRYIKSPYLHHAVVSAFEGLLRADTHPGYFLYLEVDPSSIDVNIHPTKTEIKFDDEHTIYAILRSAIKHSLGQFNIAPVLDFDQDRNLDTPYAYRDKSAIQPRIQVDTGYNPFKEDSAQTFRHSSRERRPAAEWEGLYVGLESKMSEETSFSSVHLESEANAPLSFDPLYEDTETQLTSFQLRRKYVVTTIKSGMLIIHQNRAHQRILYEKFLKMATFKEAVSQQLLFPLVLSFSRSEMSIISDIKEQLEMFGFVFEEMGEEQLKIAGIPALVAENEVGIVMDELIAEAQAHGDQLDTSPADLLSRTLSKALAVKTGTPLNEASRQSLVNDLFACREPKLCPFQKPAYITMAESEIDKNFN
ncbi:DNA mismatch repair endonuclease MutL [Lentiprolixibacter aurantiacus]|uniref:DNA mismatch repair protein MutL n=1 Tax=Lentiprolixibacter aurantiacus TaxID=2993939 RepID=A0AAE3MM72_9FLAO|nr:DNA mismatch repair endonuclease MutL [Lentiprolixibacter aurantiacus]MCX2720415.1 DNA mismatch repair endonuclease MutL [Lentiprolixibacter aurantiacus]